MALDRTPRKRNSYQDLDAAFRALLASRADLFGQQAAGVDLRLNRVAEEEVNGIPRTSLSYEQFVGASRVYDGEVTATFANNVLVAVHGEPVRESELSPSMLSASDTEIEPCKQVLQTERVYSRRHGRALDLVECPGERQLVDITTREVVDAMKTTSEWVASHNYLSSVAQPMEKPWAQPPVPVTQWFGQEHVLQSVSQCPEGTTCDVPRRVWDMPLDQSGSTWQLTYGAGSGGASMSPYPTVYIGGMLIPVQASSFNDSVSYTTSGQSLAQVAYERIAGVSGLVNSSYSAGLWGFRYPSDNGRVNVYVWTPSDNSQCGGNQGLFVPNPVLWDKTICLNYGRSSPGIDWSFVPLHEYGHYIHNSYGLGGSSCDESATQEGLADAMAVSFEWLRWSPSPGLSRLVLPVGLTRENVTTHETYSVSGIAKPAKMDMVCSDSNVYDRYAKGLAISQVIWQLLNNTWCNDLWGTCASNYLTLIPDMSAATVAAAARQTLTITMDDTGSSATIQDFMREWWYNLYYSVSWPSVWNLRQLFLRHAVSLPWQNPRGTLDSVSPNFYGPGMQWTFSGWACDPDTPANPEMSQAHIYVQGVGFATTANVPSEPAVADACSDPTYSSHRFSYTISNAALRNLVGYGYKTVQVYSIDSDFGRGGGGNVLVSGPSASVYVYPYGW